MGSIEVIEEDYGMRLSCDLTRQKRSSTKAGCKVAMPVPEKVYLKAIADSH